MTTILAPVDFSPIATQVVDEAARLARVFCGRVVLLHVTPPAPLAAAYQLEQGCYSSLLPSAFHRVPSASRLACGDQPMLTAAARAANHKLAEHQEALRLKSILCDVLRLAGDPTALILAQANSLPADYIVLGSHGHTAFHDLLLGSTTSSVIKHAPCPVLVVRQSRKTASKPFEVGPVPALEPRTCSH